MYRLATYSNDDNSNLRQNVFSSAMAKSTKQQTNNMPPLHLKSRPFLEKTKRTLISPITRVLGGGPDGDLEG